MITFVTERNVSFWLILRRRITSAAVSRTAQSGSGNRVILLLTTLTVTLKSNQILTFNVVFALILSLPTLFWFSMKNFLTITPKLLGRLYHKSKGRGKKNTAVVLKGKTDSMLTVNSSVTARNLGKADLGAVIFGCKNYTYHECLFKQLFGLPACHFSYVKNVSIGLPLFLFNYSDRKLHGIFEAASPGQLNINPYGWISDGDESTPYPAQVRVRVRKLYCPLTEDQFASIIGKNYYASSHFWFELDRTQTKRLVDLFSSLPALDDATSLQNPSTQNDLFKSLATIGPIDAVDGKKEWDAEERSDHLDHNGWADAPRLVNTDTNRQLNSGKSYASILGNTSTSTLESKTYSQKLWSSLFKPSTCDMDKIDASSDMDKTDPMLNSSSSPSSSITDKHRMDWELCLASSVDKDEHNSDTWGSEEHEEPVELTSSFVYSSMPPSQQSKLFGREYAEQEHSEITASELNLQQINELTNEWESLCGESQLAESSMDNDDVAVLDDGPTSVIGLKEEGQKDNPFVINNGSEGRESEVLETPKQVNPSDLLDVVAKLIGEVEGLKRSKLEQDLKITSLEQELVHSKLQLRHLTNMHNRLGTGPLYSSRNFEEVQYTSHGQLSPATNESVVIVGGFNGSTWLRSLDSYFPLQDRVETLTPMTFSRSHALAVKLNGKLFVLGGVLGDVWFNTVESYNPLRGQWTQQPSLCEKKGSLAGASLCDEIFAIGGGDGVQCFSEVEMLDVNIGKWIFAPSLMQKRFAPAATDINGAIYTVGGYDGKAYMKSVERFNPREHTWTTVGSMRTRKGCHSLVAYNEKLYALGGFDGDSMVSSVEILDPRFGSWVMGEQMNSPRGYSGAVVIGGKICVIGGVNNQEEVLDTIECYEEGRGWQVINSRTFGK